jgi:hypothetical protein
VVLLGKYRLLSVRIISRNSRRRIGPRADAALGFVEELPVGMEMETA